MLHRGFKPKRWLLDLIFLLIPILVSYWKLIQLLAIVLPVRHQIIHQCHEPFVVRWFQNVDHLMHDDVFKHSGGFLANSR